MLVRKSIFFFVIISMTSCKKNVDYYHLPTNSPNEIVQAVIEIPAGTNKKFEYNIHSKAFEIDQQNGKDRIVQFLPYIGNYGYIPSTHSDKDKGGDGDALDVLVLSESLPTGSIVEIIPIAVLKLIDNGEMDYKIIAIPADEKLQIIKANSFNEFETHFKEAKQIIELWFLNYNKNDTAEVKGWGNEEEALKEINSSSSI